MVAIAIISIYFDYQLYLDSIDNNESFWFQRSGALIVLAGVELQYSKLVNLWKKAFDQEMSLESVESKIGSGQGISMLEMAKDSVKTRDFTIRIHTVITEKSKKDTIAVLLMVIGTVVWAYGDLPFK